MPRSLLTLILLAAVLSVSVFFAPDAAAEVIHKTPLSLTDIQNLQQAADPGAQAAVAGAMTPGEVVVVALAAIGLIVLVAIIAN